MSAFHVCHYDKSAGKKAHYMKQEAVNPKLCLGFYLSRHIFTHCDRDFCYFSSQKCF